MPRVVKAERFKPLPPGAVYVGRPAWGHRGSIWRNPFKVGAEGARDEVIAKFRAWSAAQPELMAHLGELRGKDLACWCAPLPCHGDVLIELGMTVEASGEPKTQTRMPAALPRPARWSALSWRSPCRNLRDL